MFDMEDNKIPNKPLNFFWLVTKPHRIWLWLSIGLVIIASALSSFSNIFFKLIIDAVEANQVSQAMLYGLFYPGVIFLIQAIYRLSGIAGSNITVRASKEATNIVMTYLIGHAQNYFSNRFSGSVTNKVRNVSGALENIIPDLLWSQLSALVAFLVTFVMISLIDLQVALLFITLLVSLVMINRFMAKEKTILSKANGEAGTILQGGIADVVTNIMTVRQYARQTGELNKLKQLTDKKQASSLRSWFFTEKMLFYNSLAVLLFIGPMFWLMTTRWSSGGITTGDFILVLALMSQISGSLIFIGRSFNAIARAVGELQEGLDDILLPYEINDREDASELKLTKGEVRWQGVGFSYEDKTVFNNFSLMIPSEEKIGIVGHSGAGKSTFVSLLLRQQNLHQGAILIDGQDIATVTQDSLRQNIAVVPQEPTLFHRTIAENIAYGSVEATSVEIRRVARLAKADEFIDKLKLGYDTIVGERGVKLSGGQRQRIAIARAMLKNAPILILDEATSALDSESEQYIKEALRELMKGKTVIAIAHRLSTLREMDRIIVLEDGVICEDGNHESLKLAGGVYSRLWTHQAGGFLLE